MGSSRQQGSLWVQEPFLEEKLSAQTSSDLMGTDDLELRVSSLSTVGLRRFASRRMERKLTTSLPRRSAFGGYDLETSKVNFEVSRSFEVTSRPPIPGETMIARFTPAKGVNHSKPPRSRGFTPSCGLKIDYRGELKVIMINHGTEPFPVRRGEPSPSWSPPQ